MGRSSTREVVTLWFHEPNFRRAGARGAAGRAGDAGRAGGSAAPVGRSIGAFRSHAFSNAGRCGSRAGRSNTTSWVGPVNGVTRTSMRRWRRRDVTIGSGLSKNIVPGSMTVLVIRSLPHFRRL